MKGKDGGGGGWRSMNEILNSKLFITLLFTKSKNRSFVKLDPGPHPDQVPTVPY